MSISSKRWTVLSLVTAVLLGSCSSKRDARPLPDAPPPDLLAAQTGGAASLQAAAGFTFIPEEAVVVGSADPGEIFGAPSWRARSPVVQALVSELQKGGFDPSQTRFLYFAVANSAGEPSGTVVSSSRLQPPAAAQREVVLGAEVWRVDGRGVSLAPLPNLTVIAPDEALRRALQAGLGKDRALAGNGGTAKFKEVLERMPAAAIVRIAAVASPLLERVWTTLEGQLAPSASDLWRIARGALSAGAALYASGSAVRFAAILQLGLAADAPRFVDAALALLRSMRRGPAARTRDERLWSTFLGAATVVARETFVVVESEVSADLLVALLGR